MKLFLLVGTILLGSVFSPKNANASMTFTCDHWLPYFPDVNYWVVNVCDFEIIDEEIVPDVDLVIMSALWTGDVYKHDGTTPFQLDASWPGGDLLAYPDGGQVTGNTVNYFFIGDFVYSRIRDSATGFILIWDDYCWNTQYFYRVESSQQTIHYESEDDQDCEYHAGAF
ncbi:MAG: hypothetical protein WD772_00655 [Pseudohongiellaceae bacterium]